MVVSRSMDMGDLVRWGGVLTLSLFVHGYLFNSIDLSAKPNPIPPVEQIQISIQTLSAPKSEPVPEATPAEIPPEPVSVQKPVEEVIEPAVLPEPPAPVKPSVDVETQDFAAADWQKFEPVKDMVEPIEKKVEPTPEPKPVEKVEPVPTPRLVAKKPSLPEPPQQVAEKIVEKPAVKPETVKPKKPIETPQVAKLAPAPEAKKTEKPVQKHVEQPSQPTKSSVSDDQGHSNSTVIQNAKYRKRTPPVYPKRAYDLGQQGLVTLTALIEPNGKTRELKIETSSGHRLLDKAAMAAVKKWEFEPLVRNGVRVSSWVRVPVSFVIN
ncbi:energy transducer TonB [Sneathiella limimaris]|uniref:energy transducer TonB n=1 Tax=Sneathiella limimaris TaxID=1964213 RepID=UPI00146CC10E|nr:energy transducer TonB [Sneathiella limimaris]